MQEDSDIIDLYNFVLPQPGSEEPRGAFPFTVYRAAVVYQCNGGVCFETLEDRIRKEGQVRAGNVYKWTAFEPPAGCAPAGRHRRKNFTVNSRMPASQAKILTIEASGIAIACMAARYFDVPVVFAKKGQEQEPDGDVYTSVVHSYTYGRDYNITPGPEIPRP